MSATETPLVTPDAINKMLTAENADLRMREQVAKEANDKIRADLASAEQRMSDVYQRVSRMTLLEGGERERGGIMAMLDEISARSTERMEAAEAAEARVRELEDAHIINGGAMAEEIEARAKAEARLAAVLGAADEAVKALEHLRQDFWDDHLIAASLRVIKAKQQFTAKLDAARTGDAAHSNLVPVGSKLEPAAHPDSASFEVWWKSRKGCAYTSESHRAVAGLAWNISRASIAANSGAGVDVAALLEDKARLDWLTEHGNRMCGWSVAWSPSGAAALEVIQTPSAFREITIRAAIDAARKEGSK